MSSSQKSIGILEERQGDVTRVYNPNSHILMHGCNPYVFNAGVAKSIRMRFRDAYETFCNERKKLGHVQFSNAREKNRTVIVANCIVQKNYGNAYKTRKKYIAYDLLEMCLEKVRKKALRKKLPVICPRIGCGLAGGDWTSVKHLLKKHLCNYGVDVYVYVLNK